MSLSIEDAARLGGSDIAGILGLSPWQTPLSIYARVVAALEGRALPEASIAYRERGNVLERAVLELYAQKTGARLLPGPKLTHPDMPFVRASLDALAERDGVIVADAKTVAGGMRHHFGEEGTDQVRKDILFQMQIYVGIGMRTGHVTRPVADVPVLGLKGADPVVFTIGFDLELFSMIEAALDRFWKDHVLPRRPPPVTEPLRDVDAAGALYPRHSGEERHWDTLGTEEQRAVRDWLKARARLKRAELRAAGAEAVLKMALKDTTKVHGLPASTGARSISWKKNKARQETDWKSVAAWLKPHVGLAEYNTIVDSCTTAKEGARPLRVTETREDE